MTHPKYARQFGRHDGALICRWCNELATLCPGATTCRRHEITSSKGRKKSK